ncbi:MAG TPA: histidine kinase dimerization/phospho-acceptor domain-containing protein, partial [Puia sp.]|nr:histidine kinase dimerization/phospho-acceptor domain-containing protein [Puia sp.]
MRLKTKLSAGLTFLFTVILVFGILGIVSISRLSHESNQVLENNHESIVYTNNMFKALDNIGTQKDALEIFEENLRKQENNITEIGEREVTQELRQDFNELKVNPADPTNYPQIRSSLTRILDLNEMAIIRKHRAAQHMADNAQFWLTIIFTILILVSFTFIFNLPGIISNPILKLSEGIKGIANKDYSSRIVIRQHDEFGELARSFNDMAEKLDEYEHSNLSQIKFEKSRIETIIDQMRDGIIGFDENRRILFLNVVAEKLLGVKEADIIGKYAPDVALKNDLMRTLLQETNDKQELKIYADNKESYFNKDVLNVTSNGVIIGQVIVLRNITIFHELSEAKTNFVATISHELKTPISSIKLSAQLLAGGKVGILTPEQKELLDSIRDDSDRLLNITGELLNMTQLETGQIQLKLVPTESKQIVDQALQAVQMQATQRHITFELEMDPHIPYILSDAEKSTWVLINFLTNAVKYSPEGNVVHVAVHKKNGSV